MQIPNIWALPSNLVILFWALQVARQAYSLLERSATMADPKLTYWERNPPYAAVALAALANVPVNNVADPKATKETVPALQFASGCASRRSARRCCLTVGWRLDLTSSSPCSDELLGVPIILRYIARAAGSSSKLYGEDPLSACQVSQPCFYACLPLVLYMIASSPQCHRCSPSDQIDYWIDYACSNLVVGLGLEAACGAVNSYLALRTYLVGQYPTVADVAAWGQLQGAPAALPVVRDRYKSHTT